MDTLVFDIETNGLLDTVSKGHCIHAYDRGTGVRYAFHDDYAVEPRSGSFEQGVLLIAGAPVVVGHNIINYDLPALKKLYPKITFRLDQVVWDTLVCTRVIWPNVADIDFTRLRQRRMPEKFRERALIGTHKLEAWGYRLGDYKGDFDPADSGHTWETVPFSQEMSDYCAQDVHVTNALFDLILSKNYSATCLDLEHKVAQIIFRQYERGFAFSLERCYEMVRTLQARKAELSATLSALFTPWYTPDAVKGVAEFTPKRDNAKSGYTGGVPFSRVKQVVFNPASRDHIADRLQATRGWIPTEFTDSGKPKVDETVLSSLSYPEASTLSEAMLIDKRLGQSSDGDEAWLKHARKTGLYGRETDGVVRIHGGVNPNGAVTGRMTHSRPNVSQTPKVGVPYGKESRSCFIATPGYKLVGCDAEGLELRCLAHYMAEWDGGTYAEAVVNGKKEDGTDVHTVNRKAIGLNKRDSAKTWVYACLYGAGDEKLGWIIFEDFTEEQRQEFLKTYRTKSARIAAIKKQGKASRARFLENLPAFAKLVDAVKNVARTRGWLRGLDGRQLHVRSEHAALNTLLQSAGALIMKKALVILDSVRKHKALPFHFVANIHDEFQMEVLNEGDRPQYVGELAAFCIKQAGEEFNFKCPLSGSFDIGDDWAGTH